SEQLGYLDDTSFRRSFKTVTGYTPSEYRQKHRRTDQKR
ncbi:MAG: AraC family transcriptional regulator, partial [Gammaproteobacteria bacterium]|nr:AraC family transcriptional regulator [Gammaproteobacteria bacterium]